MYRTSRLAVAAAALVLLAGTAACAKDSSSPAPSAAPPAGASTAAAPATAPVTAPATDEPAGAVNGAASPEESLQLLLRAVSAGDAEKACRQMAYEKDGRKGVVAEDAEQMTGCAENVRRATEQAPADKKAALGMVTVNSATVHGDTATVTGKDMAVGSMTLETFVPAPVTLSRLDGRWYVDVAAVWQLAGLPGAATSTRS